MTPRSRSGGEMTTASLIGGSLVAVGLTFAAFATAQSGAGPCSPPSASGWSPDAPPNFNPNRKPRP